VLLDRGVRQQIEKHGLAFLFEDVADVFHSSDAVVVNLECPVTDTVSPVNKKYIFRADSKWMPALRSAGITHAALANNHSIDQGRRGLNSTAYHLQKAGITSLGYGLNHQSACRPVFISKHGIQVAVFNSVWLPLENWSYLEDNSCICQAGVDELSEQIRTLKKENPACYIVAVLHWGMEYQPKPAIGQRRDAYRLIDAGADVIVGHHPHVVQEKELYKSKPIFYSLGNFVFDSSSPDARKSWLLQLFFDKEGISFNIRKIKINECKPGYAR
jgi:poly-gamma-glutamate synthesis protein (capsule biosynthesis protein)